MDYNQQMEAMRLGAPEQLGLERVHRVDAAVENVLHATVDAVEVPVPEVGRTAAAAAIADAEAIVAAEAQRMSAIEAQRPVDPVSQELAQARAAVSASNPSTGNPLF